MGFYLMGASFCEPFSVCASIALFWGGGFLSFDEELCLPAVRGLQLMPEAAGGLRAVDSFLCGRRGFFC